MSPTLNTLPNELIEHILDYLSLPSFLALSLTNWHLHDLALGHLYTAFPGPDPSLFLRTITAHGHVAKYVKEVSWISSRHRCAAIPNAPQLTSAERHGIAQTLRNLELVTSESKDDLASRFIREVYGGPGKWYINEVHRCKLESWGTLYTFKPSCD